MVRAVALLLACLLSSGCFVLDELDSGKKIMDQNSAKPAAAPAPKAGPTPQKAGAGSAANAKALSGRPDDDDGRNPVVACHVGSSTRFMHRQDCLSQGGHSAG